MHTTYEEVFEAKRVILMFCFLSTARGNSKETGEMKQQITTKLHFDTLAIQARYEQMKYWKG